MMKNLFGLFVGGIVLFAISQPLPGSQDLDLKPLSAINREWLDKMGETSSWGKNPFHFPRSQSGVHEETSTPDGGGLRLSAILYHEEGSVAIINHRIVRRGDEVGGRRVVSILKDRVVLQDLSGVFELKLEPFGAK